LHFLDSSYVGHFSTRFSLLFSPRFAVEICSFAIALKLVDSSIILCTAVSFIRSASVTTSSQAVTEKVVRMSAAVSHNPAEPTVDIVKTTDDEDGRETNAEESPVKVEVSVELAAAAPPGGLLSPGVNDKPLPTLTANGPTLRVVTRPALSRTLDLSTGCVEAATPTPGIKAAAPPAANVRPGVAQTDVAANTVTVNVRNAHVLQLR